MHILHHVLIIRRADCRPLLWANPQTPNPSTFAIIPPKSRKAVKHLTSVWRKPLHQMAVLVGLDHQGGLCLQPYGFIFSWATEPEGWTSFSVVTFSIIFYSKSALGSEFRSRPNGAQKVHLTLSPSVYVQVSFIFGGVNQSTAMADLWV